MAHIVVVDDQDGMLDFVDACLSRVGHDVKTALTIADAIAAVDETTELLVADVFMPDGNGMRLADEMKERFPALQVLLMSGNPPEFRALRARPFLSKPFSPRELDAAVNSALRLSQGEEPPASQRMAAASSAKTFESRSRGPEDCSSCAKCCCNGEMAR